MTGDQRIGRGRLAKMICEECGTVANASPFTRAEAELLYGEEYELNTLGREEHFFFTENGPIARSQVFCDWIAPHIPQQARRIIEIGCGEGKLLERIRSKFPGKEIMGFDGSRRAAELGAAKGLDIRQKLLLGDEPLPESDVFILINVIEHIEDIPALLAQLRSSLRAGGRIIFCLPVQDYGGYDIFFAEHVWHFTANHVGYVLSNNRLKVLHSETDHPVNHGIGLFICEAADSIATAPPCENQSRVQLEHLRFWEDAFRRIDSWLEEKNFASIAVFGGGEVFTLFTAFTSLGDRNIVACIDDTKEEGAKKHGVPVHKTEWLSENKVDALLLAVNRKYYDLIMEKVRPFNLNVYPLLT